MITTAFSPHRYREAFQQVQRLADMWNALWCPNEREDYLRDMYEILENARCTYENALGERDNREQFDELFLQLPLAEKGALYDMCVEAFERKGNVRQNDVAAFFERPQYRPFYVCLEEARSYDNGNDDGDRRQGTNEDSDIVELVPAPGMYQDGSQRFPFGSIEPAKRALLDRPREPQDDSTLDVAVISCPCPKVTCQYPGCSELFCREHGTGRGYQTTGDTIVFDIFSCLRCGCVVCPECLPARTYGDVYCHTCQPP